VGLSKDTKTKKKSKSRLKKEGIYWQKEVRAAGKGNKPMLLQAEQMERMLIEARLLLRSIHQVDGVAPPEDSLSHTADGERRIPVE
jgi:hypothetical protein